MKRVTWFVLLVIIVFLLLPLSRGVAAPSTGAAFDIGLNFAPGSIVRFDHLTTTDDSNLLQTWWFIGLLILVLGALLAGGFRWRLNAIREQNVRLETEVTERTSRLRETNILLEREVEQRKRAEEELTKHAEQELQQSEKRFRAMFENSAVGMALMSMDRRILQTNQATIAAWKPSSWQ